MLIIFIGPDGCGKTTLINRLRDEHFSSIKTEEKTFSFGILPPLSSLIGRKNIQADEGAAGAGMVRPLGWLRCHILLMWYGLDLFLARFTGHKKKTIIFSRFYLDFFYQRAYRRAWHPLIHLFLFLGPRPDYIFVLKRSPAAIHAQKPELDEQEITLQYHLIEKALSVHPAYREIDAEGGIENTAQKLFQLLESDPC